jgi:hypothetical protein
MTTTHSKTYRDGLNERVDFLRAQQRKYENSADEREVDHAYECRCEADELEHLMGLDDIDSARVC